MTPLEIFSGVWYNVRWYFKKSKVHLLQGGLVGGAFRVQPEIFRQGRIDLNK
ncbi:MAG: hypothetical protein J6B57_11405 [Oscillospiraceae bacterium]|nr:hypothetical protein [Oscillospiraceae bacterium]